MNPRTAIINTLLSHITLTTGRPTARLAYLEIGVFGVARNYAHVAAGNKLACDPAIDTRAADGVLPWESARLWRLLAATRATFDVIFVDGDHRYQTVHDDAAQAIRHLSDGGWLVMHDCLPENASQASDDREGNGPWCGGAYRVWQELLAAYPGAPAICVAADHGVGIMRRPAIMPIDLPALPAETIREPWTMDEIELTDRWRICATVDGATKWLAGLAAKQWRTK